MTSKLCCQTVTTQLFMPTHLTDASKSRYLLDSPRYNPSTPVRNSCQLSLQIQRSDCSYTRRHGLTNGNCCPSSLGHYIPSRSCHHMSHESYSHNGHGHGHWNSSNDTRLHLDNPSNLNRHSRLHYVHSDHGHGHWKTPIHTR